jgi:hypothetical protein
VRKEKRGEKCEKGRERGKKYEKERERRGLFVH